jgi:hypothetical protein
LLTLYNQSKGDLKQEELTTWQDDEYPIILRNDGLSGGASVLFPHTFDPITDTINTIDSTGRTVERLLSLRNNNMRDTRDVVLGKDGAQRLITEFFADTYWGKPAAVIFGVDPLTGQPRDSSKENSYLGVKMTPLAEGLLGLYSPLESFNRFNPGDIFGRREYKNYRDETIVPAKNSIFGAKRTDTDAGKLAWESAVAANDITSLLFMATGARVRIIDRARNVQMTLDEIKQGINELEKSNVAERRELSVATIDSTEKEARAEKLIERTKAEFEMKYDYIRVLNYMLVKKIPPKRVLNELRDRNINVGDLEPIGVSQQLQLEAELKQRIAELKQ